MTAQIRDNIDYEGRKLDVGCDISLPRRHPRIRYVEKEERELSLTGCSGCWRGYIASWKISDGQLFLTDIIGCFEIIGDEPLPAEWVSGKIRITGGDAVEYVHMGYFSTFEHEIVLKIKKGRVIKVLKETENQPTDDEHFPIW